MITGISIENFKLFGKRVDIELAPITLLFGRNSSGKSSVLQALEYARRVVVEGDTSASGELLGGFRSIVQQGVESTELAISVCDWTRIRSTRWSWKPMRCSSRWRRCGRAAASPRRCGRCHGFNANERQPPSAHEK